MVTQNNLPGPSLSRFFTLHPLGAVRSYSLFLSTTQPNPQAAPPTTDVLDKQSPSLNKARYGMSALALCLGIGFALAGISIRTMQVYSLEGGSFWVTSLPSITSAISFFSSTPKVACAADSVILDSSAFLTGTQRHVTRSQDRVFSELAGLYSQNFDSRWIGAETTSGGVDAKIRELEERLAVMEGQVAKATHGLEEIGTTTSYILMNGPPMVDYASSSAGGSVEYAMTSGSARIGDAKWPWEPLAKGRGPDVVLKPGLEPGDCWAFPSMPGQLAIRFNQPIHLTHVTIANPPLPVSRSRNLCSSPRPMLNKCFQVLADRGKMPREIEIWAKQPGTRTFFQRWRSSEMGPRGPWHTRFIGAFTVEPSDLPFITFALAAGANGVDDLVEGIVIVFRSNWGDEGPTCLYRVRAHGTPYDV